jgi:hypothetical protein
MQLSPKTIQILKNFATINGGIVIKPGSEISTKAATNSVCATANVSEVFPNTIALYDLNQFLGTISEFEAPDIDFDVSTITISEASNPRLSFKGLYGNESMIVTLTRKVNMPPTPIEFNLTESELAKLQRMAGIQGLKYISVTKNADNKIVLVASDIENSSTNTFTLATDSDAPSADFSMIFDKASLNFVKGDYSVAIAKEGISKFTNQSIDLVYHVATLDKSYYK